VATQKYKPQKLKIVVSAKLTEDEYGAMGEALRLYGETLHEQGLDDHVAIIERAYERLTGFKLTGHK
tara:strand:+ start:3360 stop:3560 length:201 start_codon:yes stop_codon:yes gene_type:complete